MPADCPICGEPGDAFVRVRGYDVRRCRGCRHRFVDYEAPADHCARVYRDDYFAGDPGGYPDYTSEEGILRAQGRRYANLVARYLQPSRMLDVGAAAGFLLSAFVEAGWSGSGLEPNRQMAEYGRRRFGLHVIEGSLEHLVAPDAFDLVTMIQVVGHFVSPRAALASAARVTRPRGCWLIETWDPDSWTARLLGRHWHELNPPSVLHVFPRSVLESLAGEFGFKVVARGRPVKRIDGAHAKALVRHSLRAVAGARALAAILDRIVPDRAVLPYPSEDLYWTLFRRGERRSSQPLSRAALA